MSEDVIKDTILTMATSRGSDKSICPSEVARVMFGENWRKEMQTVRDAAFNLAKENQVMVMQKGKKVDPENLKGPIRIKIINPKT